MNLTPPNLTQLLYLTQHARDDEREEYEALHGCFDGDAWAIELFSRTGNGPSHVFLAANGRPYYAAGVSVLTPFVAQTWSIGTNEWRPHALTVTRTCRRVIRDALTTVQRVQIMVLASRSGAAKWCVALGATHEAHLKDYGKNGAAVDLFVVTRGAH